MLVQCQKRNRINGLDVSFIACASKMKQRHAERIFSVQVWQKQSLSYVSYTYNSWIELYHSDHPSLPLTWAITWWPYISQAWWGAYIRSGALALLPLLLSIDHPWKMPPILGADHIMPRSGKCLVLEVVHDTEPWELGSNIMVGQLAKPIHRIFRVS